MYCLVFDQWSLFLINHIAPRYNWNITESGVKHHKTKHKPYTTVQRRHTYIGSGRFIYISYKFT